MIEPGMRYEVAEFVGIVKKQHPKTKVKYAIQKPIPGKDGHCRSDTITRDVMCSAFFLGAHSVPIRKLNMFLGAFRGGTVEYDDEEGVLIFYGKRFSSVGDWEYKLRLVR